MENTTNPNQLCSLHPIHTWKSIKKPETAAREVHNKLQKSEDNGNQYLVVQGLTKYAIHHLLDDKNILGGIGFRLMYEGSAGLMKIIQSTIHACATDSFTRLMDIQLRAMGITVVEQYHWGATTMSTMTEAVTDKGKQPD